MQPASRRIANKGPLQVSQAQNSSKPRDWGCQRSILLPLYDDGSCRQATQKVCRTPLTPEKPEQRASPTQTDTHSSETRFKGAYSCATPMLHTEMTEFKQWWQPLQQRSNSAKIHQIQPLLVLLRAEHALPGTGSRQVKPPLNTLEVQDITQRYLYRHTSTAMWLQPIRLRLLCTRQTDTAECTAADSAVMHTVCQHRGS